MVFHNNMVGTPVKTAEFNTVIQKINNGLTRPYTYSYYIAGNADGYKDGDALYVGFIPMTTRLPVTIVYEIVSRGSLPSDYNVIFNNAMEGCLMVSPFVVLNGQTGGVVDGANDSTGYSSRGCNGSMVIAPGEKIIERAEFSNAAINSASTLTSSYQEGFHLDFGVLFKKPPLYQGADIGDYKGDYTEPSVYYTPSFIINVTMIHETGILQLGISLSLSVA